MVKSDLPYTVIVEQPEKNIRFRYLCESRASPLRGINSTKNEKTFPTVKVMNYTGPVFIVASCVFHESPHRAHPHMIGGQHGCRYGISTVPFDAGPNNEYIYTNFHIDYVKRSDIYNSLLEREKYLVDPFKTGFDHKSKPKSINLSAVRICYQVFLRQDKLIPIYPVLTDIIYDKRANNELLIYDISDIVSPVNGGKKIMLFCEKVPKDNIAIRFFELSDDDEDKEVWFGYGQFKQSNVHRKTAIAFKTPKYSKRLESNDVINAFVQLERISDQSRGPPLPFRFVPDLDILTNIKKRKIHQERDLLDNLEINKENMNPVTNALTVKPQETINLDTIIEKNVEIEKPRTTYNRGITINVNTSVQQQTELLPNNRSSTYFANDQYMTTASSNANLPQNPKYLQNTEHTKSQLLPNWNILYEIPLISNSSNYPQLVSTSSITPYPTNNSKDFNQHQLQLQQPQHIPPQFQRYETIHQPGHVMLQTKYHQHHQSLNQSMNQPQTQYYPQLQPQLHPQHFQTLEHYQQPQIHQPPNQLPQQQNLKQVYDQFQQLSHQSIPENQQIHQQTQNQQQNFQKFDQQCINISFQNFSDTNFKNNTNNNYNQQTPCQSTKQNYTADVNINFDVPTVVLDHELNNKNNQHKFSNNLSHRSSDLKSLLINKENISILPVEDEVLMNLMNDESLGELTDSLNSFSFN